MARLNEVRKVTGHHNTMGSFQKLQNCQFILSSTKKKGRKENDKKGMNA